MDDAFRARRAPPTTVDDLPLFAAVETTEGYDAVLDRHRLLTASGRVLRLLLAGEWVTLTQLRAVGGSSGDRRARELRALGVTLVKRRAPDADPSSGVWEYRLVDCPEALRLAVARARS